MKRFIMDILLSSAGFLLGKRGKRILFIITLLKAAKEEGLMTGVDVDSLNKTMKINMSKDSLKFPAMVANRIWNGNELSDCIRQASTYDGDRPKSVINTVVGKCPSWMMYDELAMAKDVAKLVSLNK